MNRDYVMTGIVSLDRGRVIKWSWQGGPYIELMFGGTPYANEVINVWDYAKGGPYGPFDKWDEFVRSSPPDPLIQKALRAAVRLEILALVTEWEEDGWTSWYQDYLANA